MAAAFELTVASFAQERLWFLAQLRQGSQAYHVSLGLRLQGVLNDAALERALNQLVARHEALRTTFCNQDGQVLQRIHPRTEDLSLLREDWRERAVSEKLLAERVRAEYLLPFDLERGPLLRVALILLREHECVLLITMHHIVCDGWSVGILTRELSELYRSICQGRAPALSSLPIQYADYARWQRQAFSGEALSRLSDYWKRSLADAPAVMNLPLDGPRPAERDFGGADIELRLDEALTQSLKELSRRCRVTLFMTLLAGWALVLARLSNQRDVVIGVPSANRGRLETENLIGLFVNTLAVRLSLPAQQTVHELLQTVRAQVLEAQAHRDLPFERVVELLNPPRSLSHTPIFQVMFAWQDLGEMLFDFGGLCGRFAGGIGYSPARVDLTLNCGERDGCLLGLMNYATAVFERATVERAVEYLRETLQQMVRDTAQGVWKLPLMPALERERLLLQWNATDRPFPCGMCIHQLFEAQVLKSPEAPAVVSPDQSLSYGQLNALANRLARLLRTHGVGPESRVAICVERCADMVVGLLGILKAGGAYVPLDPAYPPQRLAQMLEDCEPALILTHAPAAERLRQGLDRTRLKGPPVITLAEPPPPGCTEDNLSSIEVGLTARNLAYLIYTSGSTGRPKAAMNQHAGVVNRIVWMQERLALRADDTVLQKTPFSFDVSVWEFFWPLSQGARLVVAAPEGHRDPRYIGAIVRSQHVTVIHFVPSMLSAFLASGEAAALGAVRHVVCSGEGLPPDLVAEFCRQVPARLWNLYGPTEAAVDVTCYECERNPPTRVPIGRAVANTQCYVLDERYEPVPLGVTGELYLGGVQVGRGYWGRPELTAERFVADPFGRPGARLYRTGDLARYLPDGNLQFLGRTDHQVKLRGYRIELGEIEACLADHVDVRGAVVIAREDVPGEQRLVAYYTSPPSVREIDAEHLRAHLRKRLPEYVLPAAYVWLETMPLTSNGKLDRKGLPLPEADGRGARHYAAPVGMAEQALARIWVEVLKVERVGRQDNFFELGGHSLLAVRLIARIQQSLSVEMSMRTVFQHPGLEDMAAAMSELQTQPAPALRTADRAGPLPLSLAQQRLWFITQLEPQASRAYHIPLALRLRGQLDRAALGRALDRIVSRHESLRTRLVLLDGIATQQIGPASGHPPLPVQELQGECGDVETLERSVELEISAAFDLESGPPLRARLIRLADRHSVLLVTLHHIVADGWSIGVFLEELAALYTAFSRGREDPLPALPVQYADYAVWQREWLQGQRLREQGEYWQRTLAGAPELLSLPSDHPRPQLPDYAGAAVPVELDEALTAALQALSKRHGTTLFMTMLAAWAALLGRLANQPEVVVGTPAANRSRPELEALIGFFVNTLAIRVSLAGRPDTAELLHRVRQQMLDAHAHQDIPFEEVVRILKPQRSTGHNPIVQVLLVWQNLPELARLELPGLQLEPLPVPVRTTQLDLALSLHELNGRIRGALVYATALFEATTIHRYLSYWKQLLTGMAADQSRPVASLDILSAAERRQVLLQWNEPQLAAPGALHAGAP